MADEVKDKQLTDREVAEVITEKEQEMTDEKSGVFKTAAKDFTNGLLKENPLLVLMIGLCSSLAVSNKIEGALFMGMAATFVLFASNILISSIKKIIPDQIRIPIFIIVIASFVTIVDLTMKAYLPAAYALLGVWIPLIVVNCIILGRAEAFAYEKSIIRSAADGLGMGAGYTIVLLLMATIRETLGTGGIDFLGMKVSIIPTTYAPLIFVLFPGAFLVFGLLMGARNVLMEKLESKGEAK